MKGRINCVKRRLVSASLTAKEPASLILLLKKIGYKAVD
jgi:hypothetical protein